MQQIQCAGLCPYGVPKFICNKMKRRFRKRCPLCNNLLLKLSNHLSQTHHLNKNQRLPILQAAKRDGSPKVLLKKWEKTILNIDPAAVTHLTKAETNAVKRFQARNGKLDSVKEIQNIVHRNVQRLSNASVDEGRSVNES